MRLLLPLVANELRLYQAQRGLSFAFILALSLLAIFRFGIPVDNASGSLLEIFPAVAYLMANLQLLLMAISWESDAYAYRYYAMSGVPLTQLFFAKTLVTFIVQIPLWVFCTVGFLLFFPVEAPSVGTATALLLTCLPLGAALAPAGQLIAAIAQHSTQKNFLAIALFLPLCLPVLIAATGRVSAVLAGLETLRYDALLVAAALVFLGAGNLLFAYLFEE
jgi:ABC-type transport system involved in cytochrome c biogenesis permease component